MTVRLVDGGIKVGKARGRIKVSDFNSKPNERFKRSERIRVYRSLGEEEENEE